MPNLITDIHVHCGLKSFAADGHADYTDYSIWDYFPPQESAIDKLNFVLRAAIEETAKDSQANLDACIEGQLRVPFLSIYPIERQMFDLDPQPPFRNLFKTLLSGEQHAYLGAAVTGFPLSVVKTVMDEVKNKEDKGVDYYREYRRELAYLIRQTEATSKQHPDARFQIATRYQELQTLLEHEQTIAGLLTVEGAHSFGHYLHHSTMKKEWEELDPQEAFLLRSSFLNNLREIKTEANGQHAPLFITFCHHFNNLLAGHARSFADKSRLALGLHKPGMRHLFNQEPGLNRGFTPLGREVLELMLDQEEGRRILIDTKHMSIATRQEFYDIIRHKREVEQDAIPIIHSHGAINGWFSLEQASTKIDNDQLDDGHFFSRWQINLTDEDILETYDSDGLIGVMLHEGRMPGKAVLAQAKKLKKKIKRARSGSKRELRFQNELRDLYLKLIWSTIFHIIKVVRDNRGENGWKMITLGSDSDGMVDPLDAFPNVNSYQDLRTALLDYLNEGKEIFYARNGEARRLPTEEVHELQFSHTAGQLLEGVLQKNADQFLEKYFIEEYLTNRAFSPIAALRLGTLEEAA